MYESEFLLGGRYRESVLGTLQKRAQNVLALEDSSKIFLRVMYRLSLKVKRELLAG
jgi:hypothetical protein